MTFAVDCSIFRVYLIFLDTIEQLPKEIQISVSFLKVLKLNMSRLEANQSSMPCPACSTLSIS